MGGRRAIGSGREPRVMRVGVARRRRAGRILRECGGVRVVVLGVRGVQWIEGRDECVNG
jgi:hypothetical protein